MNFVAMPRQSSNSHLGRMLLPDGKTLRGRLEAMDVPNHHEHDGAN